MADDPRIMPGFMCEKHEQGLCLQIFWHYLAGGKSRYVFTGRLPQ
jgi:hypothetical protein